MGNIYGAIDSMPGLYQSEAGLVGNGFGDVGSVAGYDGFQSTDGAMGVEVIYSAGAFTGHLSYSDDDIGYVNGPSNKRTAVYGAYTMGDWTAALGMQDSQNDDEDMTALTVSGKVGDYGVGFSGARADGVTKITLNGSATFGATTVSAFVSDEQYASDTAMGLGFSYDLGGASLVGAVERSTGGDDYADLGVSFSF
jgi:outer membrane protein OmpU